MTGRHDIDIVDRLRWDKRYTDGHVPLTMEDAAKEIERLRSVAPAPADQSGAGRNAVIEKAAIEINYARYFPDSVNHAPHPLVKKTAIEQWQIEDRSGKAYAHKLARAAICSLTNAPNETVGRQDDITGKLWALHGIAQESPDGFTYLNSAARVLVEKAARSVIITAADREAIREALKEAKMFCVTFAGAPPALKDLIAKLTDALAKLEEK
jgi:hypothetical protein